MFTAKVSGKSKNVTLKIAVVFLLLMFVVVLGPALVSAGSSQAWGGHGDNDRDHEGKWCQACSWTGAAAFKACLNEIKDDYWIANGNCSNLSATEDRAECLADAKAEYKEAGELCRDQREARLDLCEELGEAPYDPQINPADFVDFESVLEGGPFVPNQYFPLEPGTVRKYRVTDGDGVVIERIKVEVLNETKEILGVNCIVVRDRVWEIDDEGERTLIEDTFDWYAQELVGNVWYFGEIARDYEDGELVDLEGSWKAGRDFAKPGILMWAYPEGPGSEPGETVYRQEFHLGNAEDVGEFIEFVESIEVRGITYTDVLKTKDYSPVDPGVYEYKYYAPHGVGLILEEAFEDDMPTGEQVELLP